MTDREILENYINVPPQKAAEYLDWTADAVRELLRQGQCPFGSAVKMQKFWTYNIPAMRLVNYKNGIMPPNFYAEMLHGRRVANEGVKDHGTGAEG